MIEQVVVLPRDDATYQLPTEGKEYTFKVRSVETGIVRDQTIFIDTVIPDYGPNGLIRVEGYYDGDPRSKHVIGSFKVGSRARKLGILDLQNHAEDKDVA